MGYRSIVRLGVEGVGGVNTAILKVKLRSTDDSGPVQKVNVSFDDETTRLLSDAALDRISGYVGVIWMVVGTLVWGYGDLVGRLF
jgi:hypothetical protein